MINKHIEVVTTETAGLKETAFGTVETSRRFYEVLKGEYSDVIFNVARSKQDLVEITQRMPDLAVLCVKYILDADSGEKVWLSEIFSQHAVAYTGSGKKVLQYDSNKSKAKNLVHSKGIATAKFFIGRPGAYLNENQLPIPLPLFVKPMDAANGNGIDENSLVHDFRSYIAKIDEIFSVYGVSALVEEYLSGREFTVSVLDHSTEKERLISPVEIIVPVNIKGDRVLGQLQKAENNETLSNVDEPECSLITDLVDKVFDALGAKHFGRIDVKMDAQGIPNFMEANLVPGMTPNTSYFPRACFHNFGMSYKAVVLRIVENALTGIKLPSNLSPARKVSNGMAPRKIAS